MPESTRARAMPYSLSAGAKYESLVPPSVTGLKGLMKEPTQKAGAQGALEEVKQALHDLEEIKGDWSKGG